MICLHHFMFMITMPILVSNFHNFNRVDFYLLGERIEILLLGIQIVGKLHTALRVHTLPV